MNGCSRKSAVRVKKTEVKDSPVQGPSPTHQADSLLQKLKTLLLMFSQVTSISLNATNPGSRVCPQARRNWAVMSTLPGTTTLFSKLMHSHFTEEIPCGDSAVLTHQCYLLCFLFQNNNNVMLCCNWPEWHFLRNENKDMNSFLCNSRQLIRKL